MVFLVLVISINIGSAISYQYQGLRLFVVPCRKGIRCFVVDVGLSHLFVQGPAVSVCSPPHPQAASMVGDISVSSIITFENLLCTTIMFLYYHYPSLIAGGVSAVYAVQCRCRIGFVYPCMRVSDFIPSLL